jgi:agmatinase
MDSSIDPLRLLRPPGRGLLTFTTGARGNIDLEKKYYGKLLASRNWAEYVDALLSKHRSPLILGVPSDSGAGICRGSNHGPVFLRELLFKQDPKWAESDLGDIPSIPQLSHDSLLSAEQKKRSGISLWGGDYREFLPVSPLNLLESVLFNVWKRDPQNKILIIGGDHSLSEAVFRSLKASMKLPALGVLHFDAHTDLLEERYGVAHCFGTWAAQAVKLLPNPQAFVQLGIRISGFDQGHWESKFGLRQIWCKDAKRKNPKALAAELVRHWRGLGIDNLYISFDIDSLDPKFAPSTGSPENQGLNLEWTKKLLTEILKSMTLISADLVEVAPVLGSKLEVTKTLRSAAQISKILLGAMKS